MRKNGLHIVSIVFLLVLLFLSIRFMYVMSHPEGTITSKIKVNKTYWLYLRKQSDLELDSITYQQYYKMPNNRDKVYIEPEKYFFVLDGEERVRVPDYIYNTKKEGEYYKE